MVGGPTPRSISSGEDSDSDQNLGERLGDGAAEIHETELEMIKNRDAFGFRFDPVSFESFHGISAG